MSLAKNIFIILLLSVEVLAINELVVRVPDIYISRPGYIDKSILVIEPHGGYIEQSLYLEYSDHYQFSPGQNVEVIHRFELPQGSVINDLWLWIGDSVMQAIMLDTWTARSIYDSIVSMKRDPAFLTKKGDQYELHIYPLDPGSYRKIKINFFTPARWVKSEAIAELPFLMLNANNNIVKPLEIFFRVKEDLWGQPMIVELPGQQFSHLVDTSGYKYKYTKINDISTVNSLKLNFDLDLLDGTFFKSEENRDSLNYFQFSFSSKDIFSLSIDSTSKKNLIALDLSGSYNKQFSTLIPNLKKLLKSALKPSDYFNILITGAGTKSKLSEQWLIGLPDSIDYILNSFFESDLADSIGKTKIPTLIYADDYAANCWYFPDIENLTQFTQYPNLYSASFYFNQAEIVASYKHGYESVLSEVELTKVIASLDSFLLSGGRFLTYFDFNRDNREQVATNYIQGLRTKSRQQSSVTLYRNIDGNIGLSFPESIDRNGTYFLQYDDPDVKIELKDINGNPAVISKKIGDGIIVVSGIWSFNDDAPLKKLFGVPLLGLNRPKGSNQLTEMLNFIKDEFKNTQFDKVLFVSNGDSLILENEAENSANLYMNQFGDEIPNFNSINLLRNTIVVHPSITVNNVQYLGSGYLMKLISDITGGIHFESQINDWDIISSQLSPYSLPRLEHLGIDKYGDGDSTTIEEFLEIKQEPQDPNSPKFFIGSTSAANDMKFNISAKFLGIDSVLHRSFNFPISYDTTNKSNVVYTMLGYEKLKFLFANAAYDTAQIVQVALTYNLLCDYTALLALEPNDTIHFLSDPYDESGFPTGIDVSIEDSIIVSVYPNPFNNQVKIVLNLSSSSQASIFVYNILGQLITTITQEEEIKGTKFYIWNATDSRNINVSSGIYLLRIVLTDNVSKTESHHVKKLILLR
jgi:hypothetical protein